MKDRVVLITGAAKGIGRETAAQLGWLGATVLLGARLTATWPGAEQMGARPVADGAASVVWAATLDDDGPSGGFFRDGAPLAW